MTHTARYFSDKELSKYRKEINDTIQQHKQSGSKAGIYRIKFRKNNGQFKRKDLNLLCKGLLREGYKIVYVDWLEIGQEFFEIYWDKEYSETSVLGDNPDY